MTYRTFDDWYSEIEGFGIRCERLEGPIDELRAAFAAGQSGARLTDAERLVLESAIEVADTLATCGATGTGGRESRESATLRGLLERLK